MAAKNLTKAKETPTKEKGVAIDTRKRVEMYATAAHPYLKAGEITVITEVLAENQEKRGFLVKTKAEALATIPPDMAEENVGAAAEPVKPSGKEAEAGKAGKGKGGDELL